MSKINKLVAGTSQAKPASDRLTAVLQLAELLNEEGSPASTNRLAEESK